MSALDKVEITIAVAVGSRELRLGDVLKLHRGALIELEQGAAGKAELSVGDCVIGQATLLIRQGEPVRISIDSLGVRQA